MGKSSLLWGGGRRDEVTGRNSLYIKVYGSNFIGPIILYQGRKVYISD